MPIFQYFKKLFHGIIFGFYALLEYSHLVNQYYLSLDVHIISNCLIYKYLYKYNFSSKNKFLEMGNQKEWVFFKHSIESNYLIGSYYLLAQASKKMKLSISYTFTNNTILIKSTLWLICIYLTTNMFQLFLTCILAIHISVFWSDPNCELKAH